MAPVPKRRRRGRRVLVVLGCLVLLAGAAVVMAPALVNRGLFQGSLRKSIEKQIRGTVDLGTLHLGWFGPQSVKGFAVNDASGRRAAQLDVTVSTGLLDILRGGKPLEVEVSGRLDGELRESGATSFEEILAPRGGRPASGAGPARAGERLALRGVPATTIKVNALTVRLRDPRGRDLTVEDLQGDVVYKPGERVTIDLAGRTTGGNKPGSITISAAAEGLFDDRGTMTPERGSGRLDVTLRDTPIPLTDLPTELRSLALSVSSQSLAGRVEITIKADAAIEGASVGMLEGAFLVESPVSADGSLRGGLDLLDRVTGRLTGRSVPTALFQQALRGMEIMAVRDLGPLLDIDADFSAGAERRVAVAARAQHLDLQFAGAVDPQGGGLKGERLHLAGQVTPGLFAALTRLDLDRPADVVLDLEAFSLPPAGALRDLALRGTLTIAGPASIGWGQDQALAVVKDLRIEFDSPGLSRDGTASGIATVEGAAVTFDVKVQNLLDARGRVDLAGLVGAASVVVRGLSPAVLAALVPDRMALVGAALQDPLDVSVGARREGTDLQVQCSASSPQMTLALKATRGDEEQQERMLHITEARGSLLVTPQLVAAIQPSERPIVLGGPVRAEFSLDPFSTPEWPGSEARRRPAALHGQMAIAPFAIEYPPRLAKPLVVRDFQAEFVVGTSEPYAIGLEGGALLRGGRDQDLAGTRFTAAAEGGRVKGMTLQLTDLVIDVLEALLGNPAGEPAGTLSNWIGEQGSLGIALDRIDAGPQAELTAHFKHVAGTFQVRSEGDAISVTAHEPKLSLGREAIQARLAPPPSRVAAPRPGVGPVAASALAVEADVPLTLSIRSLRVPRAILAGGSFDPAAVDCDLALNGGPLVINDPKAGRNQVENIALSLRTRDLARGVELRLGGDLILAGAPRPGKLDVQGLASGLIDARGDFRPQDAVLAMTAKVDGMHTAVLDAVAGYRGLLVDAVGPRVDIVATAKDFSRSSGMLEARAQSPNGWLEGKVRGAERAVVIEAKEPLRAELAVTPPLRERLLYRIHPLFADIRSTEQPLRATVGASRVPLDGDVSRLESDLEITVGAVEFDSGSLMLALLAFSKSGGKETIPGSIEPIKATIRKGVVTYQRFAVKIGKYTLVYSGTIDLNTQTVNLRTEIPLEGLAHSIHELQGYADDLVVPLVTRGRFGKLKTDVEPEFLTELAAKAGIKHLEKETGVPIGDILDGIFKKKKKP